MNRRVAVAGIMSSVAVAVMCMTAFAKSDKGVIKYREHEVYVEGYIDYVNGFAPLVAPDKVWASASMYGSDAWYVVSRSDGTDAICITNNGTEVFNERLIATNPKISVSEKSVDVSNSYATLTLDVRADTNNTLTLTGTD